ncbi:MAG: M20 family metallopeptidase [Candidatus Methylomirabilota bacterium]
MQNPEKHPLYPWLVETRRDFHRHPELGMKEFRTAGKIREILTGLGAAFQELPGVETGVAAVLEGQPGGKTLGLRADIDALPMAELNEVPYKSTVEGVMHSCGHDCHAAVMLGVAKRVVESGLLKTIRGRLKFIFQPAEETVTGARLMVDAGVLERPKVDRILALHMNTDLSMGQVGLYRGVSQAHTDSFRLAIQGKGVHGARPNDGIDPIVAGAHFVSALQSIVGRNLDPRDAGVVTVGHFQAGTAPNIIPDQALLRGTVRTFKTEVRALIMRRLEELAGSLRPAFGVGVEYQFIPGVPSTVNDEAVAADLFQAAVAVLGPEAVTYLEPKMGGEDFGLFTQLVPGAFMRLGCADASRGIVYQGHSPHFDVDERALPIGVEIMVEAVRRYLA